MTLRKFMTIKGSWQKLLLFSLVYFLGANIGQQLIFSGSPTVMFWLPSGVFVAILLLAQPNEWLGYILAALAANLSFDILQGRPWYASLLFSAGNSMEAILGAWILGRVSARPFRLSSFRALVSLIVFSGLLSTAINATYGALIVKIIFNASYISTWVSWWSGDALGILVVAPVFLAWSEFGSTFRYFKTRWLEFGLLLTGLIISCWLAFFIPYNDIVSRSYIVLPILLWVALRFGLRGIVAGNFFVAILSIWGTKLGLGAFAFPNGSADLTATAIQIFLSIIVITMLILAVIWDERSKSVNDLQKSETRMNKAQHVAHSGSWAWSIQENRLEWSDEMYLIFGVEKEKFSGSLSDVMDRSIHPKDRPAVDQANLSVIREKKPIPLEYRVIRPDGSIRTVWAEAGELELDDKGNSIVLTGIVQDITDRKQAEQQIIRLSRLYRSLSQINQLITRTKERLTLFQSVCQIMVEDGQFIGARIGQLDCESQLIRSIAQFGKIPGSLKMMNQPENNHSDEYSYTVKAIIERKTVVENELADVNVNLATEGFGSWAAVPIREGESIWGVLTVFSQDSNFFKDQEINLLEEAVMDLEFALAHIEEEQKRQEAENLLGESEARFASFFHASPAAIAITMLEDGRILDVNPAWEKLLGYSRDEVINDTAVNMNVIINDAEQSLVINRLREQGRLSNYETLLHCKSGEVRNVLLSIEIMEVAGKQNLLSIIIDFTERKQAEDALRVALTEKETLLRELYHRTKNNMQVIHSMLVLQSQNKESDEVQKLVHAIESKIQAMALVHEMLYQSQNLSSIDLKEYITRLASMASTGYESNIKLDLNLESVLVTLETATPLGLIVNELLSNTYKYAFPENQVGEIFISLRHDSNVLRMEYRDNGIGLPEKFDIHSQNTFGMVIIFTLAEHQLNGQVELRSDKGVQYIFEFPDKVYKPNFHNQ